MDLKQRLATWMPDEKKRRRYLVLSILLTCLLLCGFTFSWFVEFTTRVAFPVEEAIDKDMILNIDGYVDVDDLKLHLNDTVMAQQIAEGVRSNLSADVYDNIELPDMREESLGKKIIQIIFDRLFK